MTDEEIVEAVRKAIKKEANANYRHTPRSLAFAAFNAARPLIRAQLLEEMREAMEKERYGSRLLTDFLDAFIAERSAKRTDEALTELARLGQEWEAESEKGEGE